MRPEQAFVHIQQLAALGLPSRVAIPLMMDMIPQLIPATLCPFHWIDDQGNLLDMHIAEFNAAAIDGALSQNRFNVASDVPTFDKFLRSGRKVNATLAMKQMAGYDRCAFRNELLVAYEAENSVDFLVPGRHGNGGIFVVSRGGRSRPLNAQEIRRAQALVPHFAMALNADRQPAIPENGDDVAGKDVPGDAAHLIVSLDGAIQHFGAGAQDMLLHLHNQPLGYHAAYGRMASTLPPVAALVVDRLRYIQAGRSAGPAMIDLPTRWGTFRVVAVPMNAVARDAADLAILTIERLVNRRLQRVQKLGDSELTLSERRVALLMADAGSGEDIARDLGITANSYRQYAKRVYAALQVDGRLGVKAWLDS